MKKIFLICSLTVSSFPEYWIGREPCPISESSVKFPVKSQIITDLSFEPAITYRNH